MAVARDVDATLLVTAEGRRAATRAGPVAWMPRVTVRQAPLRLLPLRLGVPLEIGGGRTAYGVLAWVSRSLTA